MDDEQITLDSGRHDTYEQGHNLLEVVAHLAGEPHSTYYREWIDGDLNLLFRPKCACPVLAAFGGRFNDWLPDEDRTRLLWPAVKLLMNSKDKSKQAQRAFLFLDLAVRRWVPMDLETRGRKAKNKEAAQQMRKLDPIVDNETAVKAYRNGSHLHNGTVGDASASAAGAAEDDGVWDYVYRAATGTKWGHTGRTYKVAIAEDAAACYIAILKGEDPWETVTLPC